MGLNIDQDWVLSGMASHGVGTVLMTMPMGGSGTMTFDHTLDWDEGLPTTLVKLDALSTGVTCTLELGDASSTTTTTLTAGVNTITHAGVQPGDEVSVMEIHCAGTGVASIDWFVLQNSAYEFAPAWDLSTDADTMAFPGGGREAVAAVSCSAAGTLFAGSDVGGFAWSADGFDWITANGEFDQLSNTGGLGVWGIASPDDSLVHITTGAFQDGNGGGLFSSTDLGESWSLVDARVGGGLHHDDSGLGKSFASGKVLLRDTDTDLLYIASQRTTDSTGASLGTNARGVWVLDTLGQVCRPYDDSTLPTALTGGSSPYAALPSAMAMVDVAANDPRLVVGYKVMPDADLLSESGGLYLCEVLPSGFDCSADAQTFSCAVVDDGDPDDDETLDVRDLEPDPMVYGRVYAVDGGRRCDSASGCSLAINRGEESSVFVLDIAVDDSTDLFDSDRADYAAPDDPTWNDFSSGGGPFPYRSTNACNQAPAGTFGELVPPTDGGGGTELSTVVIDPDGDWLLAFYPLAQDSRQYGCTRSFRAPASSVAEQATAWEPLKEHEYGDYTADAVQRRAEVSGSGSWVGDQRLLEVWAPGAAHDAVFDGDAANGFDLLVASDHLWWIPQEDSASSQPGWNTAVGAPGMDMDEMPWVYSWGGEETHQVTVAREVANCWGCDGTSDRVIAGLWDVAAAELHTNSGIRDAGERDCHFESLQVGKTSVEVWQDPDGGGKWQAWYALRNQADDSDEAVKRTLVLYDDNSGTYCWDSVSDKGRTSFFGGTPASELMCPDEDATDLWMACNTTDPFQMDADNQSIGHIGRVRALSENMALVAAGPACLDDNCTSSGGEGLFLVSGSAGTGLTYDKIANYVDGSGGTCNEQTFFTSLADIAVHPDSDPTGSGSVRLFVAGRSTAASSSCGLREVNFTVGSEGSATWLDHHSAPGTCQLDTNQVRGVATTPSGRWAVVFGGRPDGSAASGGACALDLSQSTPSFELAVDPAKVALELYALVPHPHVEDLFLMGGVADHTCGTCSDEGLYALQRRFRPTTGTYRWAARLISGDDLENPRITTVDWGYGPDPDSGPAARAFVGTDGSGVWDMAISW